MASWIKRWENGNLQEVGDDVARRVHTYDEQGIEILPDRAYTATENGQADADSAVITADANRRTIEQALAGALADLDVMIAKTPAQITGSDTKELARDLRRVIRLLIRRFDGTA